MRALAVNTAQAWPSSAAHFAYLGLTQKRKNGAFDDDDDVYGYPSHFAYDLGLASHSAIQAKSLRGSSPIYRIVKVGKERTPFNTHGGSRPKEAATAKKRTAELIKAIRDFIEKDQRVVVVDVLGSNLRHFRRHGNQHLALRPWANEEEPQVGSKVAVRGQQEVPRQDREGDPEAGLLQPGLDLPAERRHNGLLPHPIDQGTVQWLPKGSRDR